ncbi:MULTISPECIES: Lrp/AsnC family transcriptional regulator [Paenibacillus]|uniref:Lrp/AsnC family transcriptional regulator n=1 Tax=Paenibacillus baimaensis TaxID=2982185 RepID=A0ABT2UHW4_9BACL|nr:Lrp/AsnC family transcriptional regulator [Paenibacillus sp. WQ 127069]MCU6793482.1 Lrp/AsnC family transcriptional regulator [Paenibacillus sp. WQ 127069]
MNTYTIDDVDLLILECLLEKATRTHKEIGQIVHLTGQAVGARVRKLEELGVIEGYTLKWNPEKIGKSLHGLITVYMKSTVSHQTFQDFVQRDSRVQEVHRITGEGCYWLRIFVDDNMRLNEFLDDLLNYGNYRLSLSIGRIK